MSARDWFADVLNLPAYMGETLLALRQLGTGVQRICERLEQQERAHEATMRTPRLATVTILCERQQRKQVDREETYEWVPTAIGGEHWMHEGESYDLQIMPECHVRNFRWFVSGDPSIVCTRFIVGQDAANAGGGGLKFGDCQLEAQLGNRITVALERRRGPS